MANKRASFVIRADGTVIGGHSSSWVSGDWMNTPLQPGDMVVVPEKVLGGPPIWKTLFASAHDSDVDRDERTYNFQLYPLMVNVLTARRHLVRSIGDVI